MYGVGRTIKRTISSGWSAFQDTRIHIKDPVLHHKYNLLKRDGADFEYFTYLYPEKKVIYREVPKVASSFILTTLIMDRHGLNAEIGNMHKQAKSRLLGPRHLDIPSVVQQASDPEGFTFTFVRDPYARLVSCYMDKFANVPIGNGSYISAVVEAWAALVGRQVEKGSPISFDFFCDLAAETAEGCFDGHWAKQSVLVPNGPMKPDFTGKFETLTADLLAVLERINAPDVLLDFVKSKHRKPADRENYASHLSVNARKMIARVYRDDFERFGYSL